MKVNYRGFELEAKRQKSLAGDKLLYYSAYRISDGWEFICSVTMGEDTEKEYIGYLKENVDEYIKDPENYED